MLTFAYYYLRSMRLYYGFVTGTTTLVGCLLSGHTLAESRTWLLFTMGFFAWGFNQIFSDWYDRHEDAINAPHRPMVTGALKPAPAFAVSLVGLGSIAVIGFIRSPWTLAFLGIGGILNIAYSFLKRVPVINCLVYACAITCCALFGYVGSLGGIMELDEVLFYLAIWVLPVHFLMCHNSYYKDVAGDRVAGVRTLQTLCPPFAFFISVIGLCSYWLVYLLFTFCRPGLALILLIVLALIIFFFDALVWKHYHRLTKRNCQLCVALLHFQFSDQSWFVCLLSLVAIELLFLWYRDEKE